MAQPVIDIHVIVRDGDEILFSQCGGPDGMGDGTCRPESPTRAKS
ncbi:hypothetical protein [Streptomyces triticiradicis]|nr:hypothetical protein [Streptomyces triticiradicis]